MWGRNVVKKGRDRHDTLQVMIHIFWLKAVAGEQKICIAVMATDWCNSYLWWGSCERRTTCRFAHNDQEMAQMVKVSREWENYQNMGCKLEICKRWKEGRCWRTAGTCRFAHGDQWEYYENQRGDQWDHNAKNDRPSHWYNCGKAGLVNMVQL